MSKIFYPSKIVDEIYSIMDDYDLNFDLYHYGVFKAISDYLENYAQVEYNYSILDSDPFGNRGYCAFSFIDENGHPQVIHFEYAD